MSVFPPGATNSKVPPCATASPPVEQPASSPESTVGAASRTSNRFTFSATCRFGVVDVDEGVAVVDERRQRADCGLALAGVVPESLAGQRHSQRPHRQLVADADGLVAGSAGAGLVDRGGSALGRP